MRLLIRIDGEIATPAPGAEVIEAQPGVYAVMLEGRSYQVRVTPNEVTVDGHQMRYEFDDPRAWKGAGHASGVQGRASITAPMPGKIVRVLVGIGDEVQAGQGILLMEAMKMQNELKAPKAGRVAALEVQALDSVTAGMVLAIID